MDTILIIDFGSQYTRLIARRVREQNVYCEIVPYSKPISKEAKGIILSGGPSSVLEANSPKAPELPAGVPLLAICYGAQLLASEAGGVIETSATSEYGNTSLDIKDSSDPLFSGIPASSEVLMSHSDSISILPKGFRSIASTERVTNAAYRICGKNIWGLQFHPEAQQNEYGTKIIKNFVKEICGCDGSWTGGNFAENTINALKKRLGNDKVVMGLSGGVDSTVAATLLQKAIGDNLHCIFVDSGLLRKNEFESVLEQYKGLGLNILGVRAGEKFLSDLEGVSDPETKRKIIGRDFVEVFTEEAKKIKGVTWLGQGTIYPDVIESSAVGEAACIKSHHNVGGLPKNLDLKLVEPIRTLFKDEVREVGIALGLPKEILSRHPFPGPGLAIRLIGEITPEKLSILQEADAIYIEGLKEDGLYHEVWQAGAILLPIKSVGVMGDERTYEYTIALRAVNSIDGMTADWARLPYDFLAKISGDIINKVKGVNRVVYDISSKPPSTIEWE